MSYTVVSPPDNLLWEAVVDGVDVLSELGARLGLDLLHLPETAGGDELTPRLGVVRQHLARRETQSGCRQPGGGKRRRNERPDQRKGMIEKQTTQ